MWMPRSPWSWGCRFPVSLAATSRVSFRGVPIRLTGDRCARRGCDRPLWKEGLCNRCWRLAGCSASRRSCSHYDPLDGYADDRDAVELPWADLDRLVRGD